MQKITTFLWFKDKAEEAARFYVSLFDNSEILNVSPMIVNFKIAGQEFMALNGGPKFKFTEAISLFVDCKDQKEVDRLWEKLSEGGKKGQCGWLKDRYGLSWQIIPSDFMNLMQKGNNEQSQRVMQAMLKMTKMDISALKKAFEGK